MPTSDHLFGHRLDPRCVNYEPDDHVAQVEPVVEPVGIVEQALGRAQLMDGKLMLVTNVKDLNPAEVVQRYKALADIERGFRVLKSEIEIASTLPAAPIHQGACDGVLPGTDRVLGDAPKTQAGQE